MSDAFSAENTSAKLDYPIGLMTIDELRYAGGQFNAELTSPYAWYFLNSTYYSITGSTWWWLLSPSNWDSRGAGVFYVLGSNLPGYLSWVQVNTAGGVRPVISLKSCVKTSGGDGSATNPYTILDTETGC